MTTFDYTDEQWARIVAAAGVPAERINRADLVEACHVFRHQHREAGSDEALRRKQKIIRALTAALKVIDDDPEPSEESKRIASYLASSIRVHAVHIGAAKASGKRKSTMYRDMLIEIAIIQWCDLGHDLGISKTDNQPGGPLVRWVKACVEPAMGPVKGTAVELVQRKIKRQVADGTGPWILVERNEAAFPMETD